MHYKRSKNSKEVGIHFRLSEKNKFNNGGMPKSEAQPIWIFLLFSLYGPSLNILGELRYVEIILLLLLSMRITHSIKVLGKWEFRFVILFFLTAFMHIFSDIINDSNIEGTLKRSFTYIILSFLIISLKYLSQGNILRLRWVILGYCVSFLTILIVGQSASKNYEIMAWRLGLGSAASIAICLIPLWFPRTYRLIGPALLAMSVVHLFSSSRALAVFTAIAGVLAILGSLWGRSSPPKLRLAPSLVAAGVLTLALALALQGSKWVATANILPSDLQQKMELQLSNPYGFVAAGRPDTVAAIYGVIRSPWLGYGSTNVDREVMAFYNDIVASSYISQGTYLGMLHAQSNKEWNLGTPSHSHLFGAWVDAGIFAAISWIFVLCFAFVVFIRSLMWRHPFSPLFIYTSLLVMWDTVFSPGPIRMDVAVRLSILIYAMEMFRRFDRAQGSRSQSALKSRFRFSDQGKLIDATIR